MKHIERLYPKFARPILHERINAYDYSDTHYRIIYSMYDVKVGYVDMPKVQYKSVSADDLYNIFCGDSVIQAKNYEMVH